MWIHPQYYLPVFNQGKRFGKVDFGRYREFLVSFGVVADLKCRVGCWRNFRLTIFQEVLLQLKNSFKTRYVSDTIYSCRTCFCWCLLGPANTRPWCHEPFSQNSLKIATVPFGIVACTFALFSDNLSRKSCICSLTFTMLIFTTARQSSNCMQSITYHVSSSRTNHFSKYSMSGSLVLS